MTESQNTKKEPHDNEPLVDGLVRTQALFNKQFFKFTIKVPIINHGVEPTIFEYPNYPHYQHETKIVYVIADGFDEAVALIKTEHTLKRDVTIRHVESVEKINDRVFIQTNGACAL